MTANVPAEVGMSVTEVDTPCLLIDLDALDRNIATLAAFAHEHHVRLRPHAKSHKSPDIAARQLARGAVGLCCQTVSEAEAMVAGGARDVLVSNEVVAPRMIARLAALAKQARVLVCVDDASSVTPLNEAATAVGAPIDVLVEIDVGAGRCGIAPGAAACELAGRIAGASHLRFAGLQACWCTPHK